MDFEFPARFARAGFEPSGDVWLGPASDVELATADAGLVVGWRDVWSRMHAAMRVKFGAECRLGDVKLA